MKGNGKYSPMTPEILVRKGDAAPSPIGAAAREPVGAIPLRMPRRQLRTESSAPTAGVKGGEEPAGARRFVYTPDDETPAKAVGGKGGSDAPADKPRRIVLTLTPHEYETLGLVAVKKNTTRHELAQSAMDAYFEWLVSEYGEACACIVGGALCRCECGGD